MPEDFIGRFVLVTMLIFCVCLACAILTQQLFPKNHRHRILADHLMSFASKVAGVVLGCAATTIHHPGGCLFIAGLGVGLFIAGIYINKRALAKK